LHSKHGIKEESMKSQGVAAALSGLVFPGVGQYYLGRKTRALLFAVVAALALTVFLHHLLDTVSVLADQVLGGSLALDPVAIEAKLSAQPTPPSATLAGLAFLACWIGSVVEVFLAPRP
jgi:hypothetical protein